MLASTESAADFSRRCALPAMQPSISATHPHGYPSMRELTRGDTTWLSQQFRFMQDRGCDIAFSRRDTIPLPVNRELAPAGYPQHTPETILLAPPQVPKVSLAPTMWC